MTAAVSSQPSAVQSLGNRSGSKPTQPSSPYDVDAGRHVEIEHFVGDLGVDDQMVELDASDWPRPSTSSSRRGSVPLNPIEIDEKSEASFSARA